MATAFGPMKPPFSLEQLSPWPRQLTQPFLVVVGDTLGCDPPEVCTGTSEACPEPNTLQGNGTTCNDYNECTSNDVCSSGRCNGQTGTCSCITIQDCRVTNNTCMMVRACSHSPGGDTSGFNTTCTYDHSAFGVSEAYSVVMNVSYGRIAPQTRNPKPTLLCVLASPTCRHVSAPLYR